MAQIQKTQEELQGYSKEVENEVRNLQLGQDSKQYYNDRFEEKIATWQKNGIKEIDYNYQKLHYLGIKDQSKRKYQLYNLKNALKK